MSNLECNNVLNNAQFGFRQRRSADRQLLQTVHDLALGLNEKSQTDCIFLDFSKAFDKVSHHLLLLKLRYYGINGPLIKRITSFLTNRTQQVICDGSISKLANVTSGVPQGSVLGPLFFSYYSLMTYLKVYTLVAVYLLMTACFIGKYIPHMMQMFCSKIYSL